jgi:multidrug efflux pump subunit AcrB
MSKGAKDSLLVRASGWFFVNWRYTFLLWVLLLGVGITVYTSVIKRAGFPPISFPISFVSGAYPGQDKTAVDSDIVVPLSEQLGKVSAITDVEATANDGFFTIGVSFDDTVTSDSGTDLVREAIAETNLPEQSIIQAIPVDPGSFLLEFDLVAQVYSPSGASVETLDAAAVYVAEQLANLENVETATPKTNIGSSGGVSVQTSFARVGLSSLDDENVAFYPASTIGIQQIEEGDILALSDEVTGALEAMDLSQFDGDLEVIASADFATEIRSNIDFLESNMLTGLLAVAFVSFLLISWRASLITGLFMITVMFSTILTIYLIGYSLNVITLFALILSLGLFVDDATIVVEAIDAHRRNKRLKALEAAKLAVGKVGLASLAGTLTTVLVFAILAAPTGILGEFIRLIPITVIIALLTSFILSMTLIPFLAKFLILNTKKVSWVTKMNPILRLESWLSDVVEKLILSVRTAKGKLLGATAVTLSIVAVLAGGYIFGFLVDNNTFPPSKDTDQLGIQMQFTQSGSVEVASDVAKQVDQIVSDTIGDQVLFATYAGERLPSAQQATLVIDLVPFTDRDVTAPELAERLSAAFAESFDGPAILNVQSVDNGPPASQFPFGVRVYGDDDEVLAAATRSIADEFVGRELENYNGDIITVTSAKIDGLNQETLRENGRRYAITRFSYDSPNPTLVSLLTEAEFKDAYSDERLSDLSINMDLVEFDAGQEGDFQDSFNTLVLAVPVAMFLMYALLALQFRSFIQPFLILLAIPFTLFGVAFGLNITDNAASFFSLVGFIGLIGIAVNNTIMLTDYANQERKAGARSVEAIAAAAKKRLRPLITTTFTTIVALLPLALSDPFWEALAYTIIFGLASSTILVLISFPYYYLGAEKLRAKFTKKAKK